MSVPKKRRDEEWIETKDDVGAARNASAQAPNPTRDMPADPTDKDAVAGSDPKVWQREQPQTLSRSDWQRGLQNSTYTESSQ